MLLQLLCGLFLPLAGTTLGAAAVFVLKKGQSPLAGKLLPGFSAGVMAAASVWSLLLPAIDMAERSSTPPWLPCSLGFLLGACFLLLSDVLFPMPEQSKTGKLVFAVTLHNVPEGMAVGIVLAGALSDSSVGMAGALALSFGIAVQNLPEGAIVSMPLHTGGVPKRQSFYRGFLSGAVEPAAAICTLLLASLLSPILPYVLSFAAGAMLYVTAEELIPETHAGASSPRDAALASLSLSAGFVLMMFLDVALG